MSGKRVLALAAAASLGLAACGPIGGGGSATAGPGSFTPPSLKALARLGTPEGRVDLVAWPGYVENGSTDKSIDWVTPFERSTGCKVDVTVAGTSDQMVDLVKSGRYDAASVSGDVSLRLIASGDVEPVNTALVPNYKDVFAGLKMKPWNSVHGVVYGIPHGRAANLLMYRTDKVRPAPTSWDVVFDRAAPYRRKVTAFDSPMYIADAALYLMRHKPELGIKNPYALDDTQFKATVDLLQAQHTEVGAYWSDYLREVDSFRRGDSVVGTAWQNVVNLAQSEKAPVAAVLPSEGATGWSDTWMIATRARHKTCAYKWLDHIISPRTNAQVAEWVGQAPANRRSCALTVTRNHCAIFHAGDEAYFDKVWYWTTPMRQCLDGRTDVRCKDYGEWAAAWQKIKG